MTKPPPQAATGTAREERFSALYARYMPRLTALCRRHLKDSGGDAEAIAQEAFARAWASAETLHDAAVWPWLATTARRLCVDDTRHWGRDARIRYRTAGRRLVPEPQPDDIVAEQDERTAAARAYAALDARDRRLIALRDLEGMSYDEIAGFEGVTVESVRGSLKRARQALRRRYRKLHGGLVGLPGLAAVRRVGLRVVNGPTWSGTWPFASRDAMVAAALAAAVLGLSQPSARHPDPSGPRAAATTDAAVAFGGTEAAAGLSKAAPSARPTTTSLPGVDRPAPSDDEAPGSERGFGDAAISDVSQAPDGSLWAAGRWRDGVNLATVLFRSIDGGATWRHLEAKGLQSNRLHFPPAYPQDNRIFASSHYNGLAVSTDGGLSFVTISPLPGTAAMAPDFSAGNPTMLLGRAPGWAFDASSMVALPSGLSVPAAPQDTNFAFSSGYAVDRRVYVGSNSFVGTGTGSLVAAEVYVCRLQACTRAAVGDAWTMPPRFAVAEVATDPLVWAWASKNLWRARDGVSFERVAMPAARGFISDIVVRNRATYVAVDLTGGPGRGGLYRSHDDGDTWQQLAPEAFGHGVIDVEALADGTLVVVTPVPGRSVLVSRDGGATWQPGADAI